MTAAARRLPPVGDSGAPLGVPASVSVSVAVAVSAARTVQPGAAPAVGAAPGAALARGFGDRALFEAYSFIKNFIGASGTNAVAIDNKIEQAMDLVKSHLMFAVREEVEVLKEKIAELMDRINQLELENSILKAHASQETLAQLSATSQSQQSSASQGQQSATQVAQATPAGSGSKAGPAGPGGPGGPGGPAQGASSTTVPPQHTSANGSG